MGFFIFQSIWGSLRAFWYIFCLVAMDAPTAKSATSNHAANQCRR